MSEDVLDSNNAPSGERPMIITVSAIIYWVFAGIGLLILLAGAAFMGAVETGLDAAKEAAEANGGTATVAETGSIWGVLILAIITTAAAIFGTIKMWSMQKLGFFIFVGANAVSIIGSAVMVGFGVGGLIFPAIFIALFGSQLKNMK